MPEKSPRKAHQNQSNSIAKRHRSANALTTTALTILRGYIEQRPGIGSMPLKRTL